MVSSSFDPWSFLMALGLSRDEVECMEQQGFVAVEHRAYKGTRLGPYFRLRWRMNGRQRVKSLGLDAELAVAVVNAIAQLQKKKALTHFLKRMLLEARRGLKLAKKDLQATMAATGRYYHGFTARKRRTSSRAETLRES